MLPRSLARRFRAVLRLCVPRGEPASFVVLRADAGGLTLEAIAGETEAVHALLERSPTSLARPSSALDEPFPGRFGGILPEGRSACLIPLPI